MSSHNSSQHSTADAEVVYKSDPPLLSSVLIEKRLGFALKWKQWKPRTVTIYSNGYLDYRTDKNVGGELNIRHCSLSYIPDEILLAALVTDHLNLYTGLTIKCKTPEGFETYFRCILHLDEFDRMKEAIKNVAKNHNVDSLGPIPQFSEDAVAEHYIKAAASNGGKGTNQSVMRRTIAAAMNSHDVRSRRDQIVARRGALRWLPVMFDNDLIHGSWWFTVGSIGFVITGAITLANSYDSGKLLGEDDSTLDLSDYRATWWLVVISGWFCILGSLSFVRALHEDPPMRPLFANWYHLQNDELLGSWFFFLACIPFIPYSLIYLAAGGYRSILFVGSLLLSIFACIACFLFVLACYPSEVTTRKNVFMPVMKVACACFCSRRWMQTHLRNDWLAGVWFFLWGSSVASFGNFVLLLEVLARQQELQCIILGTSFIENLCFLIGSAYFVSGSYPDGSMVIDDDFLSTSIHEEMEDGFYLKGGRVTTTDTDSNNAFEALAGKGFGVRRGNETSNPLLALHRLEEAHQSLAEESTHSNVPGTNNMSNNSTHNASSGNLGALGAIGASSHGAGTNSSAVTTPLVKKPPTVVFTPTNPPATGLASGVKSSDDVGSSVSGFGTSRNPNFSRIVITPLSDENSTNKDDFANSIEMDSSNFVASPAAVTPPRLSPPPK